MKKDDLVLEIKKAGQPYVDEPIIINPAPALTTQIAWFVANLFGSVRTWRDANGSIHTERTDAPPIRVGFNRVTLRWMRPRKNGELIPR